MAESQVENKPTSPLPSITIPQKRPLGPDDKHAPNVASPLNPETSAAQKRTRDQREKKATYKARGPSPEPTPIKKNKKVIKESSTLLPVRLQLPPPKTSDFDSPKAPLLVPSSRRGGRQFYEATEHIANKRNYRYTRCICDPAFPFSQYHRPSETEPYGARISFEDASPHVHFDEAMRTITTDKGYRLARANVCCREGRWYYECKITSGIRPPDAELGDEEEDGGGGHVRVGWARREASLDGPVGFDAYGYGIRDVGGQKVHMSRPKEFVKPEVDFCQGDVIGLEITLPSVSLHRKVISGVYNKAVDVSDDLDLASALDYPDTIRDRFPLRYKNHLYFEQFEYHPTKDLEELMNPTQSATAVGSAESDPPNPNHSQIPLRTLPFSNIKVHKNGQPLGTAFTDLHVFLPPASKPLPSGGAREGLDDGMLGYFPAVSVFRGGAVELNFGPDFWYPPTDLSVTNGATSRAGQDTDMQNSETEQMHGSGAARDATGVTARLRPMCERFEEQIAEDIVYDVVDEVDFWAQDGGELSRDVPEVNDADGIEAPAGILPVVSAAVAQPSVEGPAEVTDIFQAVEEQLA